MEDWSLRRDFLYSERQPPIYLLLFNNSSIFIKCSTCTTKLLCSRIDLNDKRLQSACIFGSQCIAKIKQSKSLSFSSEIIGISIANSLKHTLLIHISFFPIPIETSKLIYTLIRLQFDCQIMGNCVKSLQPKEELRRTAYYQNKPLDTKAGQEDYQFLRYPTIFKDEGGSTIKQDGSAAIPNVPRHILKTDDKESRRENVSPNMQLDNPIRNPLSAEDEDNAMLNPYNTKSAIIKLSKKANLGRKKAEKQSDKRPQPAREKENETIEAVLTNKPVESSLIFTHGDVDMEFSLSRCRAGPLTVPYILYDNYNTG